MLSGALLPLLEHSLIAIKTYYPQPDPGHHNAPRPPTGTGGARGGSSFKGKIFSTEHKNLINHRFFSFKGEHSGNPQGLYKGVEEVRLFNIFYYHRVIPVPGKRYR
jgi:hypothetical protein